LSLVGTFQGRSGQLHINVCFRVDCEKRAVDIRTDPLTLTSVRVERPFGRLFQVFNEVGFSRFGELDKAKLTETTLCVIWLRTITLLPAQMIPPLVIRLEYHVIRGKKHLIWLGDRQLR